MQGLRTVFQDQLHVAPAAEPAPLPATAYGTVSLTEAALLFESLELLAGNRTTSQVPLSMEQYGQGCAGSFGRPGPACAGMIVRAAQVPQARWRCLATSSAGALQSRL